MNLRKGKESKISILKNKQGFIEQFHQLTHIKKKKIWNS